MPSPILARHEIEPGGNNTYIQGLIVLEIAVAEDGVEDAGGGRLGVVEDGVHDFVRARFANGGVLDVAVRGEPGCAVEVAGGGVGEGEWGEEEEGKEEMGEHVVCLVYDWNNYYGVVGSEFC